MNKIYIILLVTLTGSCTPDTGEDPQAQEQAETVVRGFMGLPPPPDCDDFYDNNMHEAWADCMGVGYK